MAINTLKDSICFIIGPMSPTLTTAICFCLASCIARIVQQGFSCDTLGKISKRILSYFIFLLVANRMDAMGLSLLLGWQGTTQLLVAAWIAITEVKNIFLLVKQFGEVDPPAVISDRLNQVHLGQVNPHMGYVDSQSLDEQIRNLRTNMDQLKEWAQLQTQNSTVSSYASPLHVPSAFESAKPTPGTPAEPEAYSPI